MTRDDYIFEFLKKRGFRSKEEVRRFFSFEGSDLRKVRDMVCGEQLLSELAEAVRDKKNITVYGDYDADGIMASFILYSGLVRRSPGRIRIFMNNRFEDGYNISEKSMRRLLERFPQTEAVLTCDNGINAKEGLAFALSKGIRVLVTDHHEQGTALPEEIPAVDEKSLCQKAADREAGREAEEFCGAELARRVIAELYEILQISQEEQEYLNSLYAFSGFATITDSVKMGPANHFIARKGIGAIRSDAGFFRLLKTELEQGDRGVTADTIGFYYGPMFNAAGRVSGSADCALSALTLFADGKKAESAEAIRELTAFNERRKEMCRQEDAEAFRMIEENGWQNDPFILLAGGCFSEGINGLTAAHIVNRYHVPAAVLSPVRGNEGMLKGSARSVEGFDLFQAFSSHPEKISAGGHPMAAGLLIREEDLSEVRTLLKQDAADIVFQKPGPDFIFSPETLSISRVRILQEVFSSLEPFGPGLEEPRIALRGKVWPAQAIGEGHAKFGMKQLSRDGARIELIWWNHLEDAKELPTRDQEFLFTGSLSVHEYNGRVSIQFKVDTVSIL